MEHVAIDIGGRESQVCRRLSTGEVVEEVRLPTKQLKDYFATLPRGRLIFETCAEAFTLADAAREFGHDVRVVPATLARQLGVGARKLKTDKRDARALSEASCRIDLPSVHISRRTSRDRSSFCGMREGLVKARTVLVNTVRGFLRGQPFKHGLRTTPEHLPRGVHELYEREQVPLPMFVQRQLSAIEQLNQQIALADKELVAMAKADPDTRRLMTTPGVGPVTAVRFCSAIDEVRRFPAARDVASYVGLTPGENSSSESQHRLGITKAGTKRLRWALVQAAWNARIHSKDDPLVLWAEKVAKRRGTFVATVALARKLAVVMYALLRDQTTYTPRLDGSSVRHMQSEVLLGLA